MGHHESIEEPAIVLDANDLLGVTSRQLPVAIVVAAAGEIDVSTVQDFATAVRVAVAGQSGMVVIDLTEVEFLASTGLAVLIEAEQAASASGQLLRVVASAHRVVARSLEMSGLADRLTVCGDVEDALRAA